METLTPTPEGFTHLKIAMQRSRSVAAEGGYLDLLAPDKSTGLPALDRWVGDDRTLLLLEDLARGTRSCDDMLWLNLANMVRMSLSWQLSLTMREVRMPEPMEVLAAQRAAAAAS